MLAEAAIVAIGRSYAPSSDFLGVTDRRRLEVPNNGIDLADAEWRSQFDSEEAYQQDIAESVAAIREALAGDRVNDIDIAEVRARLTTRREAYIPSSSAT